MGEGMNLNDLSRDELEYLVEQFIHNQRDRAVLLRKLHDGITYEKLAEEFDLSVGQVKNIVYKGKDKLFLSLERLENGRIKSKLWE